MKDEIMDGPAYLDFYRWNEMVRRGKVDKWPESGTILRLALKRADESLMSGADERWLTGTRRAKSELIAALNKLYNGGAK